MGAPEKLGARISVPLTPLCQPWSSDVDRVVMLRHDRRSTGSFPFPDFWRVRMLAAQIFCPHCGQPISVSAACGVGRLREAIRLQAERFGVEAVCHSCHEGFLYSRVRPMAKPELIHGRQSD